MKRTAILVTGSRRWTDYHAIAKALLGAVGDDWQTEEDQGSGIVVIHGSNGGSEPRSGMDYGADYIAGEVARSYRWNVVAMPARWDELGKSAGPQRNTLMVDVLENLAACGYEVHVFAFPLPDSVGTWDCVRKAEQVGFKVTVINPEPP